MERDETPDVQAPTTVQTPVKTPSDKTSINKTPTAASEKRPTVTRTPSAKTPSDKNVSSKTPNKTPSEQAGTKTPNNKTPNAISEKKSAGAKTPTSAAVSRPSHNFMHPSKVHQSTTKQADSGLILGFNPVQRDANGNIIKENIAQNTPTKSRASPASQYGTPGFDFKFACQESELSDEAKKLMESVREDVARIKSQMVLDKGNETSQEQQGENRKIAKPMGKTSRFSNAHMAEFKKMDSIAGHASAFRATPGRFQPVQGKTLKRTNSKARLDEPDSQNSPSKSAVKPSAPAASGAKRVKHDKTDDTSTRRPASKEENAPKPTPKPTPKSAIARPRPAARSSLMTPTKSSAARLSSATVRPSRASMIPSLTQSPAGKTVASPRTPRTDFNPRLKSNLPTLSGLKSILRHRQPLFSRDPAKIAAGTHAAAPDFSSNLLLGGAREGTPTEEPTQTPSPKKRVVFTPCTKSPYELAQASPSPSKIPTAQPVSSDVVYPTLPTLTPEKESAAAQSAPSKQKTPTIRQVRPSDVAPKATPVPEISGVLHGIGNKKRQRSETDDEADSENVPPADPTDERSAKRVKMNTPIQHKAPTPSPVKVRTTNTPLRKTSGSAAGTPASARQRNRGVLSLSRLHMLAKPKGRS
ncbi:hypothetical protein ASPWEDRAFT_38192 [Aspergillus wentii DTO 134E9]|uniref:Erythromycin esterase n=1 Tax=Aspergillus wentii DTO 134E9 TaxID=1073089 RepID=A0A1L9RNR3_ASPWE|nr:uncharacterized protein ASPWEDRAFT_38192 [Aspergillus wentii DTO 134E9]OJJ36589.1 hypothetical protein ASPWEDRAFT_38192 [Aspergillus wentii DTO 134E9]